jgi:hypothetical protein
MRNIHIYICIFIATTQISLSQINLVQNNDIIVIKNETTLGNAWTGGLNFAQFSNIDLNLDGIQDLFVFDKSGKNGTLNGNKKMPFLFDPLENKFSYAPEYINSFPELTDWALLTDYNQDGKSDIFSSYNSSIKLYTNTSTNNLQFEFTKVITSDAGFGPINLYVSSSDLPAIIDVDGDSDIDILSFDPSGSHVYFHENKSTELYGNADSVNLVRSDNCWGRFKEDFSTNSVTLNLNEDCNEINSDGRSARHSGSTLLALELNSTMDNGLELLLGDITYDNMVMLYNGGTNEEAFMIDQDLNFPSYNESINLTRFPGAFYVDIDNDNIKDLIISPNGVNVAENHKNCFLYKNIGENSNNNIEFEFIENDFLIKEMIDVGSSSSPILYDLNNDGLLDLIIGNKGYFDSGNYNSKIALYKNIGTTQNPMFEFITEDFGNLSSIGNLPTIQSLHPTFGDIDNDQDVDMIIGDNNGQIYYFKNNGMSTSEWPVFEDYETLNIDVGSFATPQLIDLNRDGLLDLIIGERMGIDNGVYNGINYYQNTGSLEIPAFENYTPEFASGDFDQNGNEIITKSLGGIHLSSPIYLTGYTVPLVFEYNNLYHLAVGTESGLIYLYNEIETLNPDQNSTTLNLNTQFNLITNNILTTNNCVHSSPAIADINNDGLPDLIRGNASGGLELFFSDNFNVENIAHNIDRIKVFPNPNNGEFKIEIPHYINGELNIYSNLGQLIAHEKLTTSNVNISLKDEDSGIYIVRIQTEKNTFTEKIILKK